MQNKIFKNRSKKKLARTVKLAELANFFNVENFCFGLKTAFCNRPDAVWNLLWLAEKTIHTIENCCPGSKIRTFDIAALPLPQHLLDHLKVFSHRVPGHLGPLGNGAVIGLVGTEPHVLPDLPLLFGKFLRRWDPSQTVLNCLPLGVQLLDEHL